MAEWKRLTAIAGHPVNVNMDQVAFIECSQDVTELHFISGAHPEGTVILGVRESRGHQHDAHYVVQRREPQAYGVRVNFRLVGNRTIYRSLIWHAGTNGSF
jgi:hypothetical protein